MKHEIKLQPFRTPNFVLTDSPSDERSIPLKELSVETLDALCSQFRLDVFAKAGKPCTLTERVGRLAGDREQS